MTAVAPERAEEVVVEAAESASPVSPQKPRPTRPTRFPGMEEILQKVPPPPTPSPRRVTNDDGAVVLGTASRRTVLLLSRTAWRRLQEAEDLWTWVHDKAGRLLWGAVEMQPTGGGYVVTRAVSVPGSANLVKALSSGVAYGEGAKHLDYLGFTIRPRRWEPLAGLRRRGERSLAQAVRAHKLKPDRVDMLLDRLRSSFFARPVESDSEGV